jgi:hypothetical protein
MIKELLQPDSSRVVYDIRRDLSKLETMQKASLSGGPWGVSVDHGAVGSDKWWTALKAGNLKLEIFTGTVKLIAGGMRGDTLEVSVESDNEKRRWVAWKGFDAKLNGKKVCVRYVQMRPKRPFPSRPDFLVPVLLQVEIVE